MDTRPRPPRRPNRIGVATAVAAALAGFVLGSVRSSDPPVAQAAAEDNCSGPASGQYPAHVVDTCDSNPSGNTIVGDAYVTIIPNGADSDMPCRVEVALIDLQESRVLVVTSNPCPPVGTRRAQFSTGPVEGRPGANYFAQATMLFTNGGATIPVRSPGVRLPEPACVPGA